MTQQQNAQQGQGQQDQQQNQQAAKKQTLVEIITEEFDCVYERDLKFKQIIEEVLAASKKPAQVDFQPLVTKLDGLAKLIATREPKKPRHWVFRFTNGLTWSYGLLWLIISILWATGALQLSEQMIRMLANMR